MKKGINAWCFPEEMALEEIFKLAKECRYDGIELNMEAEPESGPAGRGADDLRLHMGLDTAGLKKIQALADAYGLPISSVSSGMNWKYPLTDDDPAVREMGREVIRKMIGAACAFGCDTILVVPGLVTASVSYATAYRRAVEAFKELQGYAAEKKIVIGVENVWNKFLLSPLEMAGFLDEVGSDYVKAYFDAGNVVQFSYPQSWVEALGKRIAKVHIKDFDTEIGNINGFKPLLQGSLDWGAFMGALKGVGYDSYLTAELSPYPTNPTQLIRDTSAAMDYIFNL
jgi:hexulose-6-phosphate isomerase